MRYAIRHQAAGVLPERYPERPPPELLTLLGARLAVHYGAEHPKTGQPFWLRVEEVTALAMIVVALACFALSTATQLSSHAPSLVAIGTLLIGHVSGWLRQSPLPPPRLPPP